MTDEIIHESKEKRSRRSIASFFRRMADALGRGEPVPADEEQTVTVDPAAEPDLDVEIERDGEALRLAVEMEWSEEDGGVDVEAEASKARFEVYEDNAEQWRWRLVHDNGNIIADSAEGYASKQKAEQGLESVKDNAPGAYVDDLTRDDQEVPDEGGSDATFEVYRDDADEWRWRLVHDNGNIIADGGQGYASKQKCKQGLGSVQQNCRGAPVTEP